MLPCLVSDRFFLQTPHFILATQKASFGAFTSESVACVSKFILLLASIALGSFSRLPGGRVSNSLCHFCRLAPATQLLTGANSFNDLRGHYNCLQFEESRQEIQILGDKVRTVFYLPFHHSFLLYRNWGRHIWTRNVHEHSFLYIWKPTLF